MKKILITFAVLLLASVGGLAAYITTYQPAQRAAPSEKIARTPERLARGRYLVESVLDCQGCHTQRDWSRFGAPFSGPRGAGGTCFTEKDGVPGKICIPNITSDPATGIGRWTDGELLRALREGVDRIGRKIGEEAAEVIIAAKNADANELAWEVADLWYHSLVLLAAVGADPDLVWQQLRSRHGKRRETSDK